MKIYNPISEKIEELKLIKNNEVSIYLCGPTVYDDLHIGNMRSVIIFDLLARYFKYLGLRLNFISNITDIDDKIIKKAISENKSEKEVAATYIEGFYQLLRMLNIKYPKTYQLATNYIDSINNFLDKLVSSNNAYISDGSIYFKVDNYLNEYGHISKQNTKELLKNNPDNKRSALDFALWKNTTEGIKYPSSHGSGRPGWHTECAVIISDYFKGQTIDIHGGGMDLKFPHHENENIQYLAVNKNRIANNFIYCGMLDFNNQKMSKSLGNIIKAKELFKTYHPHSFKLLIYAHLYRARINYSDELIKQYEKEYLKLKRTIKSKSLIIRYNNIRTSNLDTIFINKIKATLDNDFNTALMISYLFEYLKEINKEQDLTTLAIKLNTLNHLLNLIGIPLEYNPSDEIVGLYSAWLKARDEKDYSQADKIKKELIAKGALDE